MGHDFESAGESYDHKQIVWLQVLSCFWKFCSIFLLLCSSTAITTPHKTVIVIQKKQYYLSARRKKNNA